MDWYKNIKYWYDNALWNEGQVWDAVGKGKITENQYTLIVGENYPTERPV